MAKKTKAVKKNNHRIFAIVFSTLIILALTLLVPFSLMSVKNSTEQRSQAAGNTTLDYAERYESSGRHKFLVNTRYNYNEYAYFTGSYIPEINNTLMPGRYTIDVQYEAKEMEGRGFQIALVCTAETCPNLEENQPPILKGQNYLSFNPSDFGRGVHRNKYNFFLPRELKSNTQLRLIANTGTNIEVDFLKLYQTQGNNNRQLLMNPSFEETDLIPTQIINGLGPNAPSNLYEQLHYSGFKAVLPDYLGKGRAFAFNGPGKFKFENGQELTHVRLLTSVNSITVQEHKPYALKMTYFLPRQKVTYDSNMFEVNLGHPSQHNLIEKVRLSQASSSCNMQTGQNCQFNTLQVPFQKDTTVQGIVQIVVDSQMELYIKDIAIVNTETNAVLWQDNFSAYTPFTLNLKGPKYWKPGIPEHQAFGEVFYGATSPDDN